MLSAAVIVLATAAAVGWSVTHRGGGCDCFSVSFGRDQPGFRRVAGPAALALAHLPVSIRLSPAVGSPAGVYRSRRGALVLYGTRSPGGRFRFTAMRRPAGFGPRSLRALAHTCSVCSENRLVLLAPGVRGALLAGGNGPNSITWLERGLEMQVLGPGTTFSSDRAIAAARALARANRAPV
jgi:hypothetical protein